MENSRILIITHNKGGGSTYYLKNMINILSDGYQFIILKKLETDLVELTINDNEESWTETYHLIHRYNQLLYRLLSLKLSGIHINHLIDYPLTYIAQLIFDLRLPYVVSIHDWYYISGHPHLITPLKNLQDQDQDIPYKENIGQKSVSFINNIRAIFEKAQVVIVPTYCVKEEYQERFPTTNFKVIYHENIKYQFMPKVIKGLTKEEKRLKIGLIGDFHEYKGYNIVRDCVEEVEIRKLPIDFYHWGISCPHDKIIYMGAYQGRNELMEKIKMIDIDLFWIPSQVYEIYCYVLTEMQMIGLPILSANIPTFLERCKEYSGHKSYSLTLSFIDIVNIFDHLLKNDIESNHKAIVHNSHNNGYITLYNTIFKNLNN